jgi:predicted nuclease of predicted toxin-antitoxin system
MRFFLDENFPRPALSVLGGLGHTATHALEVFPPGTDDASLFAHAQNECAVFVSTDKDFFHTVPMAFEHHHGSLVIALRRPNRTALLQRLTNALEELKGRGLTDSIWLITDTRIFSRHNK